MKTIEEVLAFLEGYKERAKRVAREWASDGNEEYERISLARANAADSVIMYIKGELDK